MGNNLLFLQEPVKLDGLHPCKTVEQANSELDIIAPDNIKAEDIKAVSMVIVKTAFGATKHIVQQVSPVCDICTSLHITLLIFDIDILIISVLYQLLSYCVIMNPNDQPSNVHQMCIININLEDIFMLSIIFRPITCVGHWWRFYGPSFESVA
jgi:hypothetical protein